MHEYEAGIIQTKHLADKIYLIDLACNDIATKSEPGQFVQVRIGSGTDPFLRRPFRTN